MAGWTSRLLGCRLLSPAEQGQLEHGGGPQQLPEESSSTVGPPGASGKAAAVSGVRNRSRWRGRGAAPSTPGSFHAPSPPDDVPEWETDSVTCAGLKDGTIAVDLTVPLGGGLWVTEIPGSSHLHT